MINWRQDGGELKASEESTASAGHHWFIGWLMAWWQDGGELVASEEGTASAGQQLEF